MGERRALIVASQCENLNLLSFLPAAAREVADVLFDPGIGGCVPALAEGDGLLVDPTTAELDDAITAAFERASEDEATLFIALVGHGEYGHDDFYYLTRDARFPPSSRTAFLLAQRIKELLAEHSLLDGLVLLLDTCHAGVATEQAASMWVRIVGEAGRRFEVLTASDHRTAANGCFSRSLARLLRSGWPELGERLRCPDLKVVISGLCPAQTAVHLAFDGRRTVAEGDEGLWLALNASADVRKSLHTGTSAAAEIERLTRDFRGTPALGGVVAALLTGQSLVAVAGPAGSGKSALLAALARPSVAPHDIPPSFLQAILFLTARHTVEQAANELAAQLRRHVPAFAAAVESYRQSPEDAGADAFERAVLGPLGHVGAVPSTVRVAVDGIDHVDPPTRTRLLTALDRLRSPSFLGRIQVVVAMREPLVKAYVVWTEPPKTGFEDPYDGASGYAQQGYLPAPRQAPGAGAPSEPLDEEPLEVPPWLPLPQSPPPVPARSCPTCGNRATSDEPFCLTCGDRLDRTQPEDGTVDWHIDDSGPPAPPPAVGEAPAAAAPGTPPGSGLSRLGGRRKRRRKRTGPKVGQANQPRGPDARWAPRRDFTDEVRRVLNAAGSGATMPIRVLVEACANLGMPRSTAAVRDALVQLGDSVLRERPGTSDEHVGIAGAHPYDLGREVHQAVADALAEVAPVTRRAEGGPEQAYADAAEAEHLWFATRFEDAIDSLESRPSAIPVENRERWADWHLRAAAWLGPTDPLTLRAAAALATWTGLAGDGRAALDSFTALLPVAEQALGGQHPATTQIRAQLNYWRAQQ